MNNDITELRSALFDTLRDLKAGKIDLDRAKAINETAQTIINSAKVEIEHMKISDSSGTGFIPSTASDNALGDTAIVTPTGVKKVAHIHGATVTTHKLR